MAALVVGGVALSKRLWPGPAPLVVVPGPPTKPDPPIVPPVKPPVPLAGTIKVGLLFSQRGAAALQEDPILEAVQFAIEEINETDGVLGRRIEMILADGASDPAVFAQKAAKLIDEDKVEVIFGCWSSPSRKLVAEICQDPKRDRLLFYPGNHEGIEEYKNVVYLGGAPNQVLTPLIQYAYSDLGRRKVFVVGSESVYSRRGRCPRRARDHATGWRRSWARAMSFATRRISSRLWTKSRLLRPTSSLAVFRATTTNCSGRCERKHRPAASGDSLVDADGIQPRALRSDAGGRLHGRLLFRE